VIWYAVAKHPSEPWWDHLDWGAVPAWVAAILSAVSIFVTLRLIWIERNRRVNAQALGLAIRGERTLSEDLKVLEAVEIFIFNNSDAPVPAVSVKVASV